MKEEIEEESMNVEKNKSAKGKIAEEKKIIKSEVTPSKVKLQKLKDLEGKFLLVKVGTPEQPATEAQINDIQEKLLDLFEVNDISCVAFVTHHAVSMEIVEKQK